MTEPEWLVSKDPAVMTRRLLHGPMKVVRPISRPAVSDRKLRLIACACCRAVWPLLTDKRSRTAVEVSERFADGLATPRKMLAVHADLTRRTDTGGMSTFTWSLSSPSCALAELIEWAFSSERPTYPSPAEAADIFRDVIGNPFRPVALPLGPTCRNCAAPYGERQYECDCRGTGHQPCPYLTPLIVSLAQAAYDNRADDGALEPDRLLILSDALEEAGCADEEVLMHLRGKVRCSTCLERPGFKRLHPREQLPGSGPVYSTCWDCCSRTAWGAYSSGFQRGDPPVKGNGWRDLCSSHYRGCWAVDLILGKE